MAAGSSAAGRPALALLVAVLLAACTAAMDATARRGEPAGGRPESPGSPQSPASTEANSLTGACTAAVRTPSGEVVRLEVAADPASRARGLGGRDRLEPGTAMALAFPEPTYVTIWMKDMRFDIDVVWVDGDRVVDVYAHMPAPPPGTADEDLPQYTGAAPADVVLELEAGRAAALGLGPGARVLWDPDSPARLCGPGGSA